MQQDDPGQALRILLQPSGVEHPGSASDETQW